MLSCKYFIKANKEFSIDEMIILINRLFKTKNPFHCPHDRPTFIEISNYEIDKEFSRIL